MAIKSCVCGCGVSIDPLHGAVCLNCDRLVASCDCKRERRCDNTYHKKNPPVAVNRVRLQVDFNSEVCYWCRACVRRNSDMIQEVEECL